jgi:hypothetical protein
MGAALMASAVGLVQADETSPLPDAKHRPEAIRFADVPWGSGADSLVARLEARGYREIRDARTKDRVAFTGRLFDRFATVHALLDDRGRLTRWEITLPSKGERDEYSIQRKIYDDAVTEMLAKHGRRREAVERFRFPYARGDGNEARGIRQGYVTMRSAWTSRDGDRLVVEIDDSMSVVLTYESHGWSKVQEERRRKKAKDL